MFQNGERVTWGSLDFLSPPATVKNVEELASEAAAAMANEKDAEIGELKSEIALLHEGIAEALTKGTVEEMRVPLIGCTMRRLPLTEEDRRWAEGVCDG
jgi:hypothetical protein